MPDGLQVQPEITLVLTQQKASSACCGAPLNRVAPAAEEFTCRSCDRPTERVLSAPQETTHSSERNGNHV